MSEGTYILKVYFLSLPFQSNRRSWWELKSKATSRFCLLATLFSPVGLGIWEDKNQKKEYAMQLGAWLFSAWSLHLGDCYSLGIYLLASKSSYSPDCPILFGCVYTIVMDYWWATGTKKWIFCFSRCRDLSFTCWSLQVSFTAAERELPSPTLKVAFSFKKTLPTAHNYPARGLFLAFELQGFDMKLHV